MLYLAGDQRILVYTKPDHTPASFTLLNFPVDDIDQAVDELTARGVPIQRYEDFQTDDRASTAARGIRSPGSPTPPATSCRSSRKTERPRRAPRSDLTQLRPTHGRQPIASLASSSAPQGHSVAVSSYTRPGPRYRASRI